jgi:hypothetical protein
MAEQLKVGDVCEIVSDVSGLYPWTIGLECTIIGELEYRCSFFGKAPGIFLSYAIEINGVEAGPFSPAFALPEELRKKKPPTARWEDCAWAPKEETA